MTDLSNMFGICPTNVTWKNLQVIQVDEADTLWVREFPSNQVSKNLSDFQKMEAQMNETLRKKLLGRQMQIFPAKIGDRVAVLHKNHWYRGRVSDIAETSKGQEAEVFLLDYGSSVKAGAAAVIGLQDDEWASVAYQAEKIHLFALIPLSLDYALSSTQFSVIPRESKTWDPAATVFVKNLVESKPKAEFLPLQKGDHGCFHGQLTLYISIEVWEAIPELAKIKWPKEDDEEIAVDLAKLLVMCDYAKFATELLVDRMKGRNGEEEDTVSTESEFTTGSREDFQGSTKLEFKTIKKLAPRSRGLTRMICHTSDSTNSTSTLESSAEVLDTSFQSSGRGRGLMSMLDFLKCGTSTPLSVGSSSADLQKSGRSPKIEFNPVEMSGDIECLESDSVSCLCLEEIPVPTSSRQRSSTKGLFPTQNEEMNAGTNCNLSSSEKKSDEKQSLVDDVSSDSSSAIKTVPECSVKISPQNTESFTETSKQKEELNMGSSGLRGLCLKLGKSSLSDVKGVSTISDSKEGNLLTKNSEPMQNGKCKEEVIGMHEKKRKSIDCKARKVNSHFNASFISDSQDVWDREEIGDVEEELTISLRERNLPEGPCIAKLFRVFVAGESPVAEEEVVVNENMVDPILNSHIVKVLNDLDMRATRLQAYAWPAITRGTSAVIVGGKRSGKTHGYIVPLISVILDSWQHISRRLPQGIGAVLVIVCKDWRSAKYTADSLVRFLPAKLSLKVITAWGGCGNEEVIDTNSQLLGGCDILVTTAPCLARLLTGKTAEFAKADEEGGTKAFTSLARCCYLVFDDVDSILENCAMEVKQILTYWGEGKSKSDRRDFEHQLLLVASSWTKLLNSLTQTVTPLLEPIIIVADPWEAVITTRARTFVHKVEEMGTEQDKLVELLQDNRYGKSLVFVGDDNQARNLKVLLDAVAVYSLIVTSCSTMWVMKSIVQEWHSVANVVLIVCQEATSLLLLYELANADLIIHVDIPKSISNFKMRYAFMVDNLSTDLNQDTINCESHIILSKESVKRLPPLVLEIERTGKVPRELQYVAAKNMASCSQDDALCYYLKAYGKCCIGYTCGFRHRIHKFDTESVIPRKGEVTFSVIKVINASRYLVRLLSFREKVGVPEFNLRDHYLRLFMAIQQYYADPENCEQLINIEPRMLCAVKCKEKWARGQIVQIDYSRHIAMSVVFLLDEGSDVTVEQNSLYILPKHLALMPPLIVEVYLCRVQPLDFDKEWTLHASKYIDDIFSNNINKSTFVGQIELALGSTLWLSPVTELTQAGKSKVKMESLRSRLISNGFGISNIAHMEKLKDMCKLAGISLEPEDLSCELFKTTVDKALDLLKGTEQSKEISKLSVLNDHNVSKDKLTMNEACTRSLEQVDSVDESKDISNDLKKIGNLPTNVEKSSTPRSEAKGINLLQESLPLDVDVEVGVAEIESPDWFFIQLAENYERLDELELEVQEITMHWLTDSKKSLHEKSLKWDEQPCVVASSYCLAKFSDGNYYRGWVDRVGPDDTSKVFFVDHGETLIVPSSQLQPCPSYLLDLLPAQAIPCCLASFTYPPAKLKDVKRAMEKVADSVETWIAKVLEIVESEDGKMYKVELIDNSVEPPRQMSKELINVYQSLNENYGEKQVREDVENENHMQSTTMLDTSCLDSEEAMMFLQNLPNFKELSKAVKINNAEEKEDQEGTAADLKNSYDLPEALQMLDALDESSYSSGKQEVESCKNENTKEKKLAHHRETEKVFIDCHSSPENPSNRNHKIFQKPHIEESTKSYGRAKPSKADTDLFNQLCLLVPPLEAVKSITRRLYPETTWNQTDSLVVINIHLPGVEHYKCRFARNRLTFMTVVRDKFYVIEETLANEIETDSCFLKLKGMSVHIYLTKKSTCTWLLLFAEKVKRPWLKMAYQGSSLDEEKSSVSALKKSWTDLQLCENSYGGYPAGMSDSSSSDSQSDEDMDDLIS
ncbi:uncharacterized protein LOC119575241 [Penaeus monodon]|uniref:uncharacterized protein LOC119575241 n=1 Tax=Penaeus monodon TaxID=6687 RepID=UPI0018A6ED8B|nr:uncharacterized protein LOC119575241 [Penaeus monodon]XP_037778673.1 uncharacterized protein LOC119575241 [Penaeus monodon]